jgi:hypothetical protein
MLCGTAFAVNPVQGGSGVIITDNTSTSVLSEQEAEEYSVYDISLPQTSNSAASKQAYSYIDSILAYCSYSATIMAGDLAIPMYTSQTLQNYLYDCETITSISIRNSTLYVEYITFNDGMVILGYAASGLISRGVYESATDTAIEYRDGVTFQYNNFRAGTHVEMTDALLEEIDVCLENEDYDALREIEDIVVIEDENGNFAIEPVLEDVLPVASNATAQGISAQEPGVATQAFGFTNEASMLADLQSKFSMHTNQREDFPGRETRRTLRSRS